MPGDEVIEEIRRQQEAGKLDSETGTALILAAQIAMLERLEKYQREQMERMEEYQRQQEARTKEYRRGQDSRMRAIERKLDEVHNHQTRYPSLLWLLANRTYTTVAIIIATVSALSAIYISESRHWIIDFLLKLVG